MEIGPTAPLAVLGLPGEHRRIGVSAFGNIGLDGGPVGAGECDVSGVGVVCEEGLSDGPELGLTLTRGPC